MKILTVDDSKLIRKVVTGTVEAPAASCVTPPLPDVV